MTFTPTARSAVRRTVAPTTIPTTAVNGARLPARRVMPEARRSGRITRLGRCGSTRQPPSGTGAIGGMRTGYRRGGKRVAMSADPLFGNPAGPWISAFAYLPVWTSDAGWVWFCRVWKRHIQKHHWLDGGSDWWWQVIRFAPAQPHR